MGDTPLRCAPQPRRAGLLMSACTLPRDGPDTTYNS
jgi:hypothetical protein